MRTESFTRDLINVQNDLLRFAYKLTANHEDANDLLQETSLKALDNEEKYAAETNFKGWMYTIMRNLFYQQLPQGCTRPDLRGPNRQPVLSESKHRSG